MKWSRWAIRLINPVFLPIFIAVAGVDTSSTSVFIKHVGCEPLSHEKVYRDCLEVWRQVDTFAAINTAYAPKRKLAEGIAESLLDAYGALVILSHKPEMVLSDQRKEEMRDVLHALHERTEEVFGTPDMQGVCAIRFLSSHLQKLIN